MAHSWEPDPHDAMASNEVIKSKGRALRSIGIQRVIVEQSVCLASVFFCRV